jgi:nucleoside phosphorylase
LNVGDVFIATAVNGVETSAPVRLREHDIRKHETGLLVSQDRVACTIEEKRNLCRTGASAVEMEAAGVSRAARKAGVPFYCVRVVTDGAAEPFPLDFNRMRDASGRFSRTRIVLAACRQPLRIFPELVKLDKTCKRASVALGDFLANCRF